MKVYLSNSDRSLISCLITKMTPRNMVSGVITPSLPYTIPNNIYQTYSISTTGSISLNGVSVPEGVYSWSAPDIGKLSSMEITGAGSVVITTQMEA